MGKNKHVAGGVVVIIATALVVATLAAYITTRPEKDTSFAEEEKERYSFVTPDNPAVQKCLALGGIVDQDVLEDGTHTGMCLYEGRQCEIWGLYEGECEL
jgi:putative hemolysin